MASNRLLTKLNNTQLATKDNPLYDFLKQLVQDLNNISNQVGSINTGDTDNITEIINQNIIIQSSSGNKGRSGNTFLGIPGTRGLTGANGATGATGPPTIGPMGINGKDGRNSPPIPGARGERGLTGIQGPAGAPAIILTRAGRDGRAGYVIPGPPGIGREWELIDTRTCSGNAVEDFPDLGGFSDIFVICQDVTKSATAILLLRVSTDNGATFLSASGDYIQIPTTGVGLNATSAQLHSTNATAARTCEGHIFNFNLSAPKWQFNSSALNHYFIPTTTPLNAIRVLNSGAGNLNTGTIYVFGR